MIQYYIEYKNIVYSRTPIIILMIIILISCDIPKHLTDHRRVRVSYSLLQKRKRYPFPPRKSRNRTMPRRVGKGEDNKPVLYFLNLIKSIYLRRKALFISISFCSEIIYNITPLEICQNIYKNPTIYGVKISIIFMLRNGHLMKQFSIIWDIINKLLTWSTLYETYIVSPADTVHFIAGKKFQLFYDSNFVQFVIWYLV